MAKADRALIIIGGKEDRTEDKLILGEVAKRVGGGKLVVTTVAMPNPDGLFDDYEKAFRSLGLKHVFNLEINSREEATSEGKVRILNDADAIFFTGGDQMKITSQIGDTPIFSRIHEIYDAGGLIAGTSAGASVMTETMMVAGNDDQSHRIGSMLRLAPGFGLLPGVIVDQHFAERGRIGRLL